MSSKNYKIDSIVVFIAILSVVSAQSNISYNLDTTDLNGTMFQPPTWLNSSQTQYDKFIQDKYNYFITTNGNKVWVATMNLAWNQMLRNFLLGQNATFQNTSQLQQHIIDNLNSQIFTKDQISDDAYYVSSGYGQESIDRINFEVKQKFPLRTLPDLNITMNQFEFISYAYLFKNFDFPYPFTPNPSFYFKGSHANGFQALYSKQRKQIYYKYYNNSNDFMIGIDTKDQNNEILLWKTNMSNVNSEFKIEKILKMFQMFYNLPSQSIARIDKFSMPIVNLDLSRSYKDLLGLYFADIQHQKYKINVMNQKIKLQITRFGVSLEADSVVHLMLTSSRYTKYFYLDNDFWVFLKQKNKSPYLVTLVTSPTQTWTQ